MSATFDKRLEAATTVAEASILLAKISKRRKKAKKL
jgi:hypothetical protein